MKQQIPFFFICMALAGCHHAISKQSEPSNTTDIVHNAPECPVRIEAVPRVSSLKPGDKVFIHLEFTFDGSVIYLASDDFFNSYLPEVISPSGAVKELSPAGARYFGDMASGSVQRGWVRGHFNDEYDFPLSDLYDLSKPGKYRVRFERSALSAPKSQDPSFHRLPEPDFVGPVFSNTVMIFVDG